MQQVQTGFDAADIDPLVKENEEMIWGKFKGDRSVPIEVLRRELIRTLASRIASQEAFAYSMRDPVKDACSGVVVIRDADWDSQQLGVKIGRFDLISFTSGTGLSERIGVIRRAVKTHSYKMIVARVNLLDSKTAQALEQSGALLTDVLLTFRRDLTESFPAVKAQEIQVDQGRTTDAERLEELAGTIFTIDRFHCDPNLSRERSDELYRVWVRNSLSGYADTVLVARDQGRLVGFIALKIEKVGAGHSYGLIDLIGVDPEYSGKGVGSLLVNHAIRWARERVSSLYVGTQGANSRAIRLYERNGFRLVSSEATLHLWS